MQIHRQAEGAANIASALSGGIAAALHRRGPDSLQRVGAQCPVQLLAQAASQFDGSASIAERFAMKAV